MLQQLFYKVVRGLDAQGWERSVNSIGTCVYRGPDGRKCAAGHLIKDEHYSRNFERSGVLDRRITAAIAASNPEYSAANLYYIKQLQALHDGHKGTAYELKQRFMAWGVQNGMDWPL
jgi:hypothetical protein